MILRNMTMIFFCILSLKIYFSYLHYFFWITRNGTQLTIERPASRRTCPDVDSVAKKKPSKVAIDKK